MEILETAAGDVTVIEISGRLWGEPEGESHHFLHVYIDSRGNQERIVRGPDEIT